MSTQLLASLAILLTILSCTSVNQSVHTAPPSSGSAINDMEAVRKAAIHLSAKFRKDEILVVFDIDNTLLASETSIGSDQWYTWQSANDTPIGEKWAGNNFACLLQIQGLLYELGSMRPTSDSVNDIKSYLDDNGYSSVVLTSRGPQFRDVTLKALARNGLDFSDGALAEIAQSDEIYKPYNNISISQFSPKEVVEYKLSFERDRPRDVIFDRGIYMTSGQHKGAMLRLLLSKHNLSANIKAIVFVDDHQRHITGMISALDNVGVTHYAYLYQAEKEEVALYDAPFKENQTKQKNKADWCSLRKVLPQLNSVFPRKFEYFAEEENCLTLTENLCN